MRRLGPALIALLCGAASAHAAVTLPIPGMVRADGEITGLTSAGSRIVLTGGFGQIGPYVGGGVALDTHSGARNQAFARFDGQVSDVITDGHGGWYVAGQFRLDGSGPRSVAHVLASGGLDPDFHATMAGFATSLALVGQRLYVGRWYGSPKLVVLDAATGVRDTAFRTPSLAEVTELLVVGHVIYAGTTNGVGAFNADTGQRNHAFSCDGCNDRVMSLAWSNDRLYVGFQNRGLQAQNIASGEQIEDFRPQPNKVTGGAEDRGPMVLLVDGNRLIVGGRGMQLGGPSSSLVALNLDSGAPVAGYGRGFSNPIHDMVVDGDSLLTAGAPRGSSPAPVLRVDRGTGAYESVLVPKLDGAIDALAVDGRKLFVGGRFGTANAVRTDGVAEVDARTGVLVPGFAVHGMPGLARGAAPLVAGDSLITPWDTQSGSNLVAHAVAWSLRTGARKRAFAPRGIAFPPGYVFGSRWAATAGRVYVAHAISLDKTIWDQSGIDVLSTRTGARIAHYALPYRGYVDDLEPHGAKLFVGGSFRRRWPDGRPRNLATMAVNPLTGAIYDGFDAHTNGPITDVGDFADRLFLDGYFTIAYGRKRNGFASVYDNTGAINGGFSQRVAFTFNIGDGLLGAQSYGNSAMVAVSPYTGNRVLTIPAIQPGFRGDNFVLAPGGAYVTATLNLPYYDQANVYNGFAAFVRPVSRSG